MLEHILSIDSLVQFKECIILQHTGSFSSSSLVLRAKQWLLFVVRRANETFIDCGATHFRDDIVKQGLRERAPDHKKEIEGMTFGEITGSLDDNVKNSIAYLRENPLVSDQIKENVRGFVFDIKTGELKEVKA